MKRALISCLLHGDYDAIIKDDFKGICPLCDADPCQLTNGSESFDFPGGARITITPEQGKPLTVSQSVYLLNQTIYNILSCP